MYTSNLLITSGLCEKNRGTGLYRDTQRNELLSRLAGRLRAASGANLSFMAAMDVLGNVRAILWVQLTLSRQKCYFRGVVPAEAEKQSWQQC